MLKPDPNQQPTSGASSPAATLSAAQLQRHAQWQRAFVVALGCLWLLAFATGCGRNTKNCSAYDGTVLPEVTTAGCTPATVD